MKESSNVIGGEPRGRPLGLHTSGQIPKVKGLQSAYMAALLVPRVWPLEKSLGASKTKTQTLVERSNFFSIKYSESDKRTLIIHFNELLSLPLERSLGFGLLVRAAKCEEALSASFWWAPSFDTIGPYFSHNRAAALARRGLMFIKDAWNQEDKKFLLSTEAANSFGLCPSKFRG